MLRIRGENDNRTWKSQPISTEKFMCVSYECYFVNKNVGERQRERKKE